MSTVRTWALIAASSFLIGLGSTGGCGWGKPVCSVIDAAHDTCVILRYLGPHGETIDVHVPKGELESFARMQSAKQAEKPDAGAP